MDSVPNNSAGRAATRCLEELALETNTSVTRPRAFHALRVEGGRDDLLAVIAATPIRLGLLLAESAYTERAICLMTYLHIVQAGMVATRSRRNIRSRGDGR